jgi:iron complex transport system substrate-binding protein
MYTISSSSLRAFGAIAGLIAITALACDERKTPQEVPQSAPESALRIVSLSPGLSRLLVEFGLAPQIVGVDTASRKLPELATCVDLGDPAQVDLAAIAALRPGIVLALGEENPSQLGLALQERGIPARIFRPVTSNGVIQAMHELGTLLDREFRANYAVRELTRETSRIATLRDGKQRLKVVWILERDPLVVVGNRGLLHEMLELAGGEMALHQLQGERVEATLETLQASEPDVVLDSTPENVRGPIAIEARTEALPTSIGEVPTLDLLERIRLLHALLYPSQ